MKVPYIQVIIKGDYNDADYSYKILKYSLEDWEEAKEELENFISKLEDFNGELEYTDYDIEDNPSEHNLRDKYWDFIPSTPDSLRCHTIESITVYKIAEETVLFS